MGKAHWRPGSARFPVRLELFGSRFAFALFLVVGAAFFTAAILCELKDSGMTADTIRWLFFLASCGLSTGIAVVVVELACPIVEVRHFDALMTLPSSWRLYKFWIWIICIWLTKQQLWTWGRFDEEGNWDPNDPRYQCAMWADKIVNVVALFTTVTMILVFLSKVMVSNLYSRKHSHQVLTALRQESILADLAECTMPTGLSKPAATASDPDLAPEYQPPDAMTATGAAEAPVYGGAMDGRHTLRRERNEQGARVEQSCGYLGLPRSSALGRNSRHGALITPSSRPSPHPKQVTNSNKLPSPASRNGTVSSASPDRYMATAHVALSVSGLQEAPQRRQYNRGLASTMPAVLRPTEPAFGTIEEEEDSLDSTPLASPAFALGVESKVPPAEVSFSAVSHERLLRAPTSGPGSSGKAGHPARGRAGCCGWFACMRASLAAFGRKARQLKNGLMLQDVDTVHIRATLVQALYLVHKLEAPETRSIIMKEEAAAAALRAAHAQTNAAVQARWTAAAAAASKAAVRETQSAPALGRSELTRPPPLSLLDPIPPLPPSHAPMQEEPPHHLTWNEAIYDKPPTWLKLTSPRRLLDELLNIYSGFTDQELSEMATTYAKLVFATVSPADSSCITRQDLININIAPEGVEMVWDIFDKDGDDKIVLEEIKKTAMSFYQQRRNLALTVHAMRNLTSSIQVAVTLLINGVFFMVVYLTMLDLAQIFAAGKTSLDFFSSYMIIISLMFGETIRSVLVGATLLLVQQPFDIGEEIVVEEQSGWKYAGVIQDFNLMYIRIKKGSDGEQVTLPLSKLTQNKFTNLSRSDWLVEINSITVDQDTSRDVLHNIKDKCMAHIKAHPSEYDTEYGFDCYFHNLEKGKLVIRTYHRYRFSLASQPRRIARARDGIIETINRVFLDMKVSASDIVQHVPENLPKP